MSRDELVNAYIDGSVSRRTFIRRLVGAGVSVGAAVSYAHLLSPERAGAQTGPDFYPDFYRPPQLQLSLTPKQLPQLSKDGLLEVLVTVQEPAQIALNASATGSGSPGGAAAESAKKRKRKKPKQLTIASLVVNFPSAGQQLIRVPLNSAGLKLIRGATKVTILVTATATDRQGSVTTISDQQSLKRKKKKRK